jgi:hypothetical protein
MNILCPNCQKTLTVPEECAGQMMQCPLCQGTFTMPALAGSPAAAPMPPAAAAAGTPGSFSLPTPPSEVYSVAPEPVGSSPAAPPKKQAAPPRDKEPAMPIVQDLVLPSIAGEYRHALPIKVSLPFLRWLVPVCLILIFLFSFLPWVGAYPGGHALVSQSGWGTAFGGWWTNPNLEKLAKGVDKTKDVPGASVLMIFYLILICLLLLASIAVIVFNVVPSLQQPPLLKKLLQMQGLILGGASLFIFLFLGIELLKGFNLSNQIYSEIDKGLSTQKAQLEENLGKDGLEIAVGMAKGAMSLQTTFWFRLVVLFNLLAIIGGALDFWMGLRGNKPPPKLEFAW